MAPAIRQTSFSAGELDPKLWGRTDIEVFGKGLRRCRNFFVSPQGALVSRPGTIFLGETKGAGTTKAVRLVPFVYSDAQTYVLEFGHLYVRFWSNGAQVNHKHLAYDDQTANFQVGETVTGIVSGATGLVLAMSDAGATGLLRLANVTGTFVDDEEVTGLTSAGSAAVNGPAVDTPADLVTEWTEGDLDKLQWAQTGDILTLTHPLRAPKELRRTGHELWSLADVSFTRLGPFFADVDDLETVTSPPRIVGILPAASATGDRPGREWRWKVTTVAQHTATGHTFETLPVTVDSQYNPAGDIDIDVALPDLIAVYPDVAVTLQREETSGLTGWPYGADEYKVIAFNYYRGRGDVFGFVGQTKSRTFVDTGAEPDYALQPPRGDNPFNVYDKDGDLERTEEPATIAFFQERRVFGGSVERPGFLWFSATGDYVNFDERYYLFVKEQALVFDLLTRRRETIRTMVAGEALVVGTDASKWIIDGGPGGVLGYDSYDLRAVEAGGVGYLPALQLGGTVLFVSATARSIRGLSPSARVQRRWDGRELTTIAAHLFRGPSGTVVDWAFAEEPYGLVWAVRADGVLLSLTLGAGSSAWAWHDTDGEVQNVCSVPEGGEDAVYLVVKRTVDSEVKRYVERMVDREPEGSEPICLDCAVGTLNAGEGWGGLGNLTHLEGKSVYVVGSGQPVLGPFVVEGGALNAVQVPEPPEGTVLYAGLLFTPEAETLDVAQGEARLKQKTVVRVGFEVYASKGLHVGPDFDHLVEWRQRQVSDDYDAVSAATDLVVVPVKGGWNAHARAALRQTVPLPVTILGLTRELEVGG